LARCPPPHVRWGASTKSRGHELRKLADWIASEQSGRFVFDKDLIVVGDLNIPSTNVRSTPRVTSKG